MLSAVVLYALTSSPYTLALAALGPIVAVASYLDGVRQRRRTARRDAQAYTRRLAEYDVAVVHESSRRLAAARLAAPAPLDILEGTLPPDTRWRRTPSGLIVVLGRAVEQRGSVLAEAPLTVALAAGIGVVGPAVLTRAFVRGLVVQCAELVAPDALAVELPPGDAWESLRSLPHARADSAAVRLAVVERAGGAAAPSAATDHVVVLAENVSDLPPSCRCVVQLGARGGAGVVGRVEPGVSEPLSVDYVSSRQAGSYALALARASGGGAPRALPAAVLLSELGALQRRSGERGLPAVIGRTAEGPLELDLVRDGPHAIVGGTTGSGKSELLITWILALAARHGPAAVTFLLADFKGGAGFASLERLPHVTGVITDLDPDGAARAFASVAAELRRREVVLAQHGVPDIARLGPGVLARLVIVVDECAVVLERAPELHRVFADIAARGRSLGVHLVLCTQRPVGVVRDAVSANCGLRIALRVHDAADSRSLIGTDAAARIPHGSAGRCIVSVGGRGRLVQAALARPEDVDAAQRSSDRVVPVHRPWLDPLPSNIPLPTARATGAVLLGLVDRPDEQRQDAVRWERRSLLILGSAGSGRSGVLRTLAGQLGRAPITGPGDAEEAWDAVTGDRAGPLLLDDLDLLLRRCADDERRRLLDALQTVLRSGTGRVVVSARRLSDGLATLRDAFDDVLLLRASNRQEHQLVALDGEPFRSDLPPGGGWWHGDRIQVFAPGPAAPRESGAVSAVVPIASAPLAVLTNRVETLRSRLREAGLPALALADLAGAPAEGALLLGSVTDWTPRRGLLQELRARSDVVLDLPPSEARLVLGPLGPAPLCRGDRVLLEREGRLRRARWPSVRERAREESAA